MSKQDIALMAHLMRRAGFGATRDELEACVANGYEATVEELLNASDPQTLPDDIIRRYHVDQSELRQLESAGAHWMYRMINTTCPLEEKIALFWHSLFATANQSNPLSLLNQIDMLRRCGLGSFKTILVEVSRDPAMIIWLDANDNHKDAINENYGRELLELFSMGRGNYTEQDIKACARAFTGWTLGNAEYMAMRVMNDSFSPYSRIAWHFSYREDDHDDGAKTFLGQQGDFNGEEVIDIIVQQEATARFVSTRLFQFFAADQIDQAGDKVVRDMMQSYLESGHEIQSVLRTLFNSDYFKSEDARFARVKSPIEIVVGTTRMAGTYRTPTLGVHELWMQAMFMGQGLLSPPSVEGWHEGAEWIDSGSLVERINFAAWELGHPSRPGVQDIIARLATENGGILTPEELVDRCLDLLGPIDVQANTRVYLIEHAEPEGALDLSHHQFGDWREQRVADTLRLVASTMEYQLA